MKRRRRKASDDSSPPAPVRVTHPLFSADGSAGPGCSRNGGDARGEAFARAVRTAPGSASPGRGRCRSPPRGVRRSPRANANANAKPRRRSQPPSRTPPRRTEATVTSPRRRCTSRLRFYNTAIARCHQAGATRGGDARRRNPRPRARRRERREQILGRRRWEWWWGARARGIGAGQSESARRGYLRHQRRRRGGAHGGKVCRARAARRTPHAQRPRGAQLERLRAWCREGCRGEGCRGDGCRGEGCRRAGAGGGGRRRLLRRYLGRGVRAQTRVARKWRSERRRTLPEKKDKKGGDKPKHAAGGNGRPPPPPRRPGEVEQAKRPRRGSPGERSWMPARGQGRTRGRTQGRTQGPRVREPSPGHSPQRWMTTRVRISTPPRSWADAMRGPEARVGLGRG